MNVNEKFYWGVKKGFLSWHFLYIHQCLTWKKNWVSQITVTKLCVPLSEPVSNDVKHKIRRVLSAFHATPVSVSLTDLLKLSWALMSAGFMQPDPGEVGKSVPH